jgi:tetratricopeptide (TPR) repeat protein
VEETFEAFGFFADAVSVYPDHIEAHYRLGVALLALGEKEYAIEEYGTLKRLDGDKAAELQLLIAESLSQ